MNTAILAFWIAFVVSAVLALPILRTLIALKSRQTVSQFVPEHSQKQGTPTMGGLIVVVGAVGGLLALTIGSRSSLAPAYWVLLAGFALVGFLDDFVVPRALVGKRGLGWKQKFGLEILFAAIALTICPGVTLREAVVGVFLILFFSNAYNFADGMDGLAGGVGIFLLIGLVALDQSRAQTTACALILIGGLVPFLVLNAPPAKVFMGDVGSLPIGAWIGLMAFQIARVNHANILPLAIVSVVMIVELLPVPLQIASVKLRKKRMFFMTPIHHGFEKKGVAETRVVWSFILGQLMLSAAAISVQWLLVDAR